MGNFFSSLTNHGTIILLALLYVLVVVVALLTHQPLEITKIILVGGGFLLGILTFVLITFD